VDRRDDACTGGAGDVGIRSVPTLLVVEDGQVVAARSGMPPDHYELGGSLAGRAFLRIPIRAIARLIAPFDGPGPPSFLWVPLRSVAVRLARLIGASPCAGSARGGTPGGAGFVRAAP